jgi:hypothetical protein
VEDLDVYLLCASNWSRRVFNEERVRAVAAVFVLMFVVVVSSPRKEGSGLFSEAGMKRGRSTVAG